MNPIHFFRHEYDYLGIIMLVSDSVGLSDTEVKVQKTFSDFCCSL